MSLASRFVNQRTLLIFGYAIIAAVVFLTYYAALRMPLYADDFEFLERAGRLAWYPYLNYYLNDYAFFRLVPYVALKIAYALFGGNASSYHLGQILLHIFNSFMLCWLVSRVSRKWQIGMVSALFFATIPVIHLAVFWVAVADPLSTFLYLGSLVLWVLYIESGGVHRFMALAVAFALALMTKEMNATVLLTMFLLQHLLMRGRTRVDLRKPYVWLGCWWLGYGVFAFSYQSQRAPAGNPNALGEFAAHFAREILPYVQNLLAPWGIASPANYVWLVFCVALYLFVLARQKNIALLFLGLVASFIALPLLPFLCGCGRYLYLPIMISAILFALVVYASVRVLAQRRASAFAIGLSVVVLFVNSIGVAGYAEQFDGVARSNRTLARALIGNHPQLPAGTLLYVLDPPMPTRFLSGQLFLHYGAAVLVESNETDTWIDLGSYPNAIVIYPDEDERWHEQVFENGDWRINPSTPADFGAQIRLERVQIVESRLKRGDSLVLFLYWRALQNIDRDYTVFVHLVDAQGTTSYSQDAQPRSGRSPTSAWRAGKPLVDSHVLNIPSGAQPGDYRLEVGLYFAPTMERLPIVDTNGNPIADHIVIESFKVTE
jgi:hypothetical protein